MAETPHNVVHAAESKPSDADGHRIKRAVDEIIGHAEGAIRLVTNHASHLAQDTLERGRVGVRTAER